MDDRGWQRFTIRQLLDLKIAVDFQRYILINEKVKEYRRIHRGADPMKIQKTFDPKPPGSFSNPQDYLYYRQLMRTDFEIIVRMTALSMDIQDELDGVNPSLREVPQEPRSIRLITMKRGE